MSAQVHKWPCLYRLCRSVLVCMIAAEWWLTGHMHPHAVCEGFGFGSAIFGPILCAAFRWCHVYLSLMRN